MAKNKKWNKVIARIQALEDALASLLSGKTAPTRKKAKKKAAVPAKAKKAARKPVARKPVRKKAAKPAHAVSPQRKTKALKKNLRVTVAENAPIVPAAPLLSL